MAAGDAPAAHPSPTFLNPDQSLAAYAQNRHNELIAQLRFMGLLVGIEAGSPEGSVERARNGVMEALSEFLAANETPLREQVDRELARYRERRDDPSLFDRFGVDEALRITELVNGIGSMGHPGDLTPMLGDIAGGSRTPNLAADLADGRLSPAGAAHVRQAANAYRSAAELQQAQNAAAAARRREWWSSVWDNLTGYYHERLAEIRAGRAGIAFAKTAIDAAYLVAEEIIYAGIIAAVVAVTGGAAAAIAPALRIALSVASRGARALGRAGNAAQAAGRQAVDKIYTVTLTKVRPAPVGNGPQPGPRVDTMEIDVENHPSAEEKASMGEAIGSNREPDAVEPEPAGGAGPGNGPRSQEAATSNPQATAPRTIDDLLVDGEVPSGEGFTSWWNDLSADEHAMLWADKDLRSDIKNEVLGGRRTHEWLKRSQLQKFKELGFSMDEIRAFVTPTRLTEGPDPERPPGTRWHHNKVGGGRGSGPGANRMHSSLDEIIANATSRNDLLRRYGYWANWWLDDGIDSLPPAMRDAIILAGGG